MKDALKSNITDIAGAEVTAAGSALGDALAGPLRAPGAAGFGAAIMVSGEALAQVALEARASCSGWRRAPA